MGTIWQDVRYGVRMLAGSPGLTAVAVLALALGVGANTAIFSVVNTVLLRPLPFKNSEQLVRVWATNAKKGVNNHPTSFLNFVDWQTENHVFESMTAYSAASATLTGGDAPELVKGVVVSAGMFPTLGVQPMLGRFFSADEAKAGNAPVVVLGYGLWQRRFGADRKVIGREITLDGKSTTIVGVMPPGFKFPLDEEKTDFWSPHNPDSEMNAARGARYLSVVARLKPNVTLQQAQAEMDTISSRLEQQYPANNTGRGVRLVSMYEDTVGSVRPALLVLLGAVGCVLLIACANVANLLLARAAGRHKEIAIRTALGATRARIVRQLLTESLLLAIMGGSLGLLLAMWGLDLLVATIPASVPRVAEISLDARVLGFTLAVSALTGIIFGLAPALTASKLDLNESLKEGGRGSTEGVRRNRVRSLLVVSEIALSLVLLIGAGLLLKSFQRLREINPGFNPTNVLTMNLELPESKYAKADQQGAFFQQLLERTRTLPGVESLGVIDPLPLSGNNKTTTFNIEGRPPVAPTDQLSSNVRTISSDYFRAMGIPLLKGRALSERDNKDAPLVMVVNETLARQFFPNEDPLGKRATVYPFKTPCEIVGVVGDVKHRTLEGEPTPEFYISYLQAPQPAMALVARTASGDPTNLVGAMRNAVGEIDKDQPISDIQTMNQLLSQSIAPGRFNMLLLGLFAFIALLLAAIGIFGVMSYSVTQRTHEIGIRIALGAQAVDVLRLVVGQGMALALVGVGLGLLGAIAVTRLMASLLYGVSATDPLIFAGISLLLTIVAFVACYVPARRAMKVDPMVALRHE